MPLTLKHGNRVRYVGPTDRDFGVVHGTTYTTFGGYPKVPMKGDRVRDEISVYVDDPRDDFGGVVSRPADEFIAATQE